MFGKKLELGRWYVLKNPLERKQRLYKTSEKMNSSGYCDHVYDEKGKPIERGYVVVSMYVRPKKKIFAENYYKSETVTYEFAAESRLQYRQHDSIGGTYSKPHLTYEILEDIAVIDKLNEIAEKNKKDEKEERENFKNAILKATSEV